MVTASVIQGYNASPAFWVFKQSVKTDDCMTGAPRTHNARMVSRVGHLVTTSATRNTKMARKGAGKIVTASPISALLIWWARMSAPVEKSTHLVEDMITVTLAGAIKGSVEPNLVSRIGVVLTGTVSLV